MSKIKWLFLMTMLFSMGISSCFIDIDDDDGDFFGCIDGDGPIISEELFLDDFDGIRLELSARVVITQGPTQSVVVEGKQNIIDELDLDVRGGIWEIETNECVSDIGNMTFFITIPVIRSLTIAGSGEIVSPEVLVVDDIDVSILGSGDIDLGLDADDIEAIISGSGQIRLEGIADDIDIEIDGSGDYRGFNMETRTAFVRIAGSADVNLRVLEELIVRISGSGDVRFRGNPALDVIINGSGEVIDAN